MPINTNSVLERLQARYEAEKKKEIDNQTSNFDFYTNEDKLPVNIGFTVCRVLDLPVNCNSSFIKCDDGKVRLFKFPSLDENPDFILYQIVDRVLKQVWKGQDKKGVHIFEKPVEEGFSEIYKMIRNNGDLVDGQYGPNGWGAWKKYGKYRGCASNTSCFLNAINRIPFSVTITKREKGEDVEEVKKYEKDWCIKNKHSLLLVKSVKSVGCPVTIGNLLVKTIFPNYGNYAQFDVAIERLKDDPYYQIFPANTLKNNQEVFPHVIEGDLTDEEKAIDTYNLEDLSKPSPYSFIYNNLKGKISEIDKALGTTYLEILERAVEADIKPTSISAPKEEKVEEKVEEKPEVKVEEKIEEPKKEETKVDTFKSSAPVERKVEASGDLWEKVKSITFKDDSNVHFIDKLSDDQKKFVVGVEGDNVKYNTDDLSACPYCKKSQPTLWEEFCVYCGKSF